MGTFGVDSREQKLFNFISRLKPYKVTKFVLDQAGTNGPTLNTVISNELDLDLSDIKWTYDGVGAYIFDMPNFNDLFTNTKIFCTCGVMNAADPLTVIHCNKFSVRELYVTVFSPTVLGPAEVDGQFWIEIKQYN